MESLRRRERSMAMVNGHSADRPCVSDRLKSIDSAMTWIREELEEIKESDRTLMEIFKQLEGDVSDLNTYVHSWRQGIISNRDSIASEGGRPVSASDLDLSILSDSNASLESTLTSSKEESVKAVSELHTGPDEDSAHGSAYSPVLSSQGQSTASFSTDHHRMINSVTSLNIVGTKPQSSPQMKTSASMNKISTHSPSPIARLQDVSARNSSESLDSGIQFENGSATGVEATNTVSTISTIPETEGCGDFATDIFSALGIH